MSKELLEKLRYECGHDSFSVAGCTNCEAADTIQALEFQFDAQLAELIAISEALGTSEGHSSVYWIEQLKQQRDELLAELLRVKEICLREVGIGIVNEVVIASMKKSK